MSCPARGMGVEMSAGKCVPFAFVVMPREGHGSRNSAREFSAPWRCQSCPARGMGVEMAPAPPDQIGQPASCPARGMGVEISCPRDTRSARRVMPREGHGSRNVHGVSGFQNLAVVMPREGHGSRNSPLGSRNYGISVMPREGHGSRNQCRVPACP